MSEDQLPATQSSTPTEESSSRSSGGIASGSLLLGVLGLIVLAVLAGGIAGFFIGRSQAPEPEVIRVTAPAESTGEVSGSPGSDGGDSISSERISPLELGQSAEVDPTLEVTVESFKPTKSSPDTQSYVAVASLKNIGSRPLEYGGCSPNEGDAFLVDDAGRRFDVDEDYSGDLPFTCDSINPGMSSSVNIGFTLPKDASPELLLATPPLGGADGIEGQEVPWKVN